MPRPVQIKIDEYDPRPADLIEFSADWREPAGWLIKTATWSRASHVAGVALVADRHLQAEVRRRRGQLATAAPRGERWARQLELIGTNEQAAPIIDQRKTLRALEERRREGWQQRPLLLESTTLAPRPCVLRGTKIAGVQAHDPQRRIREYRGRAWLYRPTPDYRLDPEQSDRLTSFLLRHLGDHYDYVQAGVSPFPVTRSLWWGAAANLHSLYCSEYWCAALQQIRLLSLANPSVFSPGRLLRTVQRIGSLRLVGEFLK